MESEPGEYEADKLVMDLTTADGGVFSVRVPECKSY